MSVVVADSNRRNFLKTSVAGATGLLIGFHLPWRFEALAAGPSEAAASALNAWIHIGADDMVTILIDKSEMGQSILTGLAMTGQHVKFPSRSSPSGRPPTRRTAQPCPRLAGAGLLCGRHR